MSHSKGKNWWYRGMLWLVLMALVVSPAAAERTSGSQQVLGEGNPGAIFIYLVADTFDPLQRQPNLPQELVNDAAEAESDGAYLVQFKGPVLMEWVQALEALGAQVGPYVPDYAFIVRLDSSSKPKIESLSFVRWVGAFEPAYRISPRAAGREKNSYLIALLPWADQAAVSSRLAEAALETPGQARVERYALDGLSVVLDAAGVQQAARLPGVLWVEPMDLNELFNDKAGEIMNAGTAWSQSLDGTDVMVGAVDTGLDVTHSDFAGRIVQTKSYPVVAATYGTCVVANVGADDLIDDKSSGHGTHVTGSMAGSGDRSGGLFKGIANNAPLTFQAVEQLTLFNPACATNNGYYLSGIPADVGVLLDDAYLWGVRVHNNSWGSNSGGAYLLNAANYDKRIALYGDLLVTAAAGNYGRDGIPATPGDDDGIVDTDSISSLGAAKNVLTVGASDSERTTGGYATKTWSVFLDPATYNPIFPSWPTSTDYVCDTRIELAAFSSRGPTDDGRIKPDVVAPGTNIISTRASTATGTGWGVYDTYYMYFGGTSMASPLAAGAAALVRDYYIDKLLVANPSAALIKATLINTAVDISGYGIVGYEAALPIPNMHEGWGRIDVGAAVTTGARQVSDQKTGLATGEVQQWTIGVAAGKPFKVTLVWSDKEALANAAKTLVNNLDLEVTAPDGVTVYRGNKFSGGWSVTGGLADTVNNVENVYIQSPVAGTWQVKVKGDNIPNGKQPFALVVDGNLIQQPPLVTSISPNTGLNTSVLEGALISGSYLLGATSVELVKDAATINGDILANSDTQIKVDFDLTGKTPGVYDLEVTTPFGLGTLAQAFTVLDASLPDLNLTLETVKNTFLEGEPITFTVRLENDSLIPAGGVTFTQTYPVGMSLLAVTPECVTLTPLPVGYRCEVGGLAAGEVLTYMVTAEAAEELTGLQSSEAVVSAAVDDRWVADNTDQVVFALDVFFLYLPLVVK